MENTQQPDEKTEYIQTLMKRMEVQRNDALNNVALLEAELMKAQKIIDSLKAQLAEKTDAKD